ncbi:MAG: hypothetical protein ACR2NW_00400 [Thermodesulfobacteriota bacterium]
MGPPKVLDALKPISSINTTTILGAPSGAFTSKSSGVSTFRASNSVMASCLGGCIGRIVRSISVSEDETVCLSCADELQPYIKPIKINVAKNFKFIFSST